MADNWTPVTDPALLQQLEGGGSWKPVDPTTSKFLDQVPAGGQAPVKTGMPSMMTDFLYGMRQPIDQGKAMLAKALFPSQVPNVAAATKAAEEAYRQEGADFGWASTAGRLAGNVATTAPISFVMPGAGAAGLGARMLSGAASATATGSLQPVDVTAPDFWQQTRNNALLSAPAGAAAPAVLSGLARLVNPKATARIAPLMERGVRPTPGQILGGSIGRLEEAATSSPFLGGDFVRSARGRAGQQFVTGAIDDVLAPIGAKLETGVTGRDAIAEMGDKIRDAYHTAIPKAGGILDQQALQEITNLNKMAAFMPADRAQQFQAIMRRSVLDKIAPNGGLTGEAFKEAESDLGKLASPYLYNHNATSDERALGGALRELQSTMRNWLERVNPGTGLKEANESWKRMLRVENASVRSSQEPGQFTPAQLLAGISKYSSQGQFAKGRAPMETYADAAQKVLGNKVPDSGTPFRSMAAIMGSAALGHTVSPEAAMGMLGTGAGVAGLYSPWGQAAMAHLLGGDRFGLGVPAAQAIRNLTPAGAAVAPWAGAAIAPWAGAAIAPWTLGGAPAH